MSNMRSQDQKATAVSISLELYEQAKSMAQAKHMSISGFFRYCIAKELGYSEAQACDIAQHEAIRKLLRRDTIKPKIELPKGQVLSSEVAAILEAEAVSSLPVDIRPAKESSPLVATGAPSANTPPRVGRIPQRKDAQFSPPGKVPK